jgi:hypothetical protein
MLKCVPFVLVSLQAGDKEVEFSNDIVASCILVARTPLGLRLRLAAFWRSVPGTSG